MPCFLLQRKTTGFQEETSDLEIQLLELGLIFEDSIDFNGNAIDEGISIANPVPVLRYQLDNHLGSASLELDESANIISYEEYYPYGDSSYRAGRNIAETGLKRYRYTGKEKDEESGLYYHGARYYACWLGRWTASDPVGLVDGVNLYAYVNGNPVRLTDPSGKNGVDAADEKKGTPRPQISNNQDFYVFGEVKTSTDAGHGDKLKGSKAPFDPGTVSGTDYEKDFALKVEEQVDHWLNEFGVQNQRTRTGDITLGEGEKKLQWRIDKAEDFNSSALISIHIDSGNKAGLFSLYKTEQGKKLGQYIAQNVTILPLKEDGLKKDDRNLLLLRKFNAGAAVIVELGGIGNTETKSLIDNSSSDIGKEIATGIYQYLHDGKKPEIKKEQQDLEKKTLFRWSNYGKDVD